MNAGPGGRYLAVDLFTGVLATIGSNHHHGEQNRISVAKIGAGLRELTEIPHVAPAATAWLRASLKTDGATLQDGFGWPESAEGVINFSRTRLVGLWRQAWSIHPCAIPLGLLTLSPT
jgi:hypothetical protein